MRLLAASLLFSAFGFAAEIVLPSPALERDRPVRVVYRTGSQANGKGELALKWTDVFGRIVDERKLAVELTDESEFSFTLDLRRAVAMTNELHAHFSFDGVNQKGAKDHREEDASVSFIARPPDRRWWDYMIVMWQDFNADQFALLETIGVNAGQISSRTNRTPEFLLKNDLRWYAESIATDFYAEYHRWRPDRAPNWSFLQAKELHRKDPTSKEPFKRHPSFSDPAWVAQIRERAARCARFHSPYRPIFYSLGDESGVADLAAFWDFDFSDQSLAEMRTWLRERYGTLAALNRQWGTQFATWDLVTPQTTDEAMKRTDDNFSSWSDHKEWMDVSFARALKAGVDGVTSVDPDAYVAIGGGQMPGWGGYDYARLTEVLTAIEPYDIGDNIEIIRSLNPAMPFVTTGFARGPWEKHRLWYELLHGARGQIIWDDKFDNVTKEGKLGDRGREVSPYYNEFRNGVATLLMNSTRQSGPIAIHYSQASMRAEWMLSEKSKGAAWVKRSSSTERMESEFLRLRESYCRLIEDLGLQYNFVSYGQVEAGELLKHGYRVLILPRSSALSPAEVKAIREFAGQGGLVIADGEPGVFDEHCRRLPQPSLAGLFTRADVLPYYQDRLINKEGPVYERIGKFLAAAGVSPAYRVVDASNHPVVGVETHEFRNGGVTILGLLNNPELRVDELGPPEFKSNERFEKPRDLRVTLPAESYVYEIRTGKALGRKGEILLTLDPYEPALYALSPVPLPALTLSAPRRLARGETARIALSTTSASPAAAHVLHLDVLDPNGTPIRHYSGNLLAPAGNAEKLLPVANNDVTGKWTVRARDTLTGRQESTTIEVF